MGGDVQETCGLGVSQELAQTLPHSRTWGFVSACGHHQSSQMSRTCVPSKRGHEGATLQECDRERVAFPRIGLTLFEQHQEKGIRADKSPGSAQLLLQKIICTFDQGSHPVVQIFFLPFTYNSLSPTEFSLYSLCCICSESVVEFKNPVSCLLLYSYETKRVDLSYFL